MTTIFSRGFPDPRTRAARAVGRGIRDRVCFCLIFIVVHEEICDTHQIKAVGYFDFSHHSFWRFGSVLSERQNSNMADMESTRPPEEEMEDDESDSEEEEVNILTSEHVFSNGVFEYLSMSVVNVRLPRSRWIRIPPRRDLAMKMMVLG